MAGKRGKKSGGSTEAVNTGVQANSKVVSSDQDKAFMPKGFIGDIPATYEDFLNRQKLETKVRKDGGLLLGESSRYKAFKASVAGLEKLRAASEAKGVGDAAYFKWHYYVGKYGTNQPFNIAHMMAESLVQAEEIAALKADIGGLSEGLKSKISA